MEERNAQANWEQSIRNFIEFVNRESVFEVVDPNDEKTKRAFMPLDIIQRYLQQRNYANLNDITAVLFPKEYTNPKEIIPKYTRVFCTLLYSGYGHYIKQFKRLSNLRDVNLPFDPENPPNNLPPAPGPGNQDFWRDICKEQWRFCAPEFECPVSNEDFDENRVLPIIFKKWLAGGGTSTLWLIKLHPDYNKLISDESKSRLGDLKDTFVLKEYSTNNAQAYYDNETAAFDKVDSNENIIGYYGSFTRGGKYHVILEYADKGNLKDFFQNQFAPVTAESIIQFWEGLFKLIDGLRCIHTVQPFGSTGPRIFQGWHQDIKPENILIVSDGSKCSYLWKFKLADLGISHFRMTTSPEESSTARDRYGTRTYGAPECSRPDAATAKTKLTVQQNVDIWSLGCIFSETVRWLAFQKSGISDYREERKTEIAMKHAVGVFDGFHDGERVLDAVRKSHDKSVKNLHRGDSITDSVVHMIKDMLVDAPERHTADYLWRKQLRIINEARDKMRENETAAHSRSVTLPAHLQSLDLAPSRPISVPGQYGIGIPSVGEDGVQRREDFAAHDNNVVLSPLGQHTPPDTSQYASYLTPDPDEFPLSPTASQPGDLYGLSPPRNIRGANGNTDNSGMAQGSTGGSPPKMRDLDTLNRLNGAPPSRPNSIPNAGILSLGGDASNQNRPGANQIMRGDRTSDPTSLASPTAGPMDQAQQSGAAQQELPPPPPHQTRPLAQTTRSEPIWTIDKAIDWKHKCKQHGSEVTGIRKDLQSRLKGRDHVFLIDDSTSMSRHWDNVVKTFEALSYIVKKTDKDGLDIYFTISEVFRKQQTETGDLVRLVEAHKRQDSAVSDINLRLTYLLEEYQRKLEKKRRFRKGPANPLSLYILTDGVWEDNSSADEPIRNAVEKLSELKKSSTQIGIQLISFGNNTRGLDRLRHLDDGLGLQKDIVDTEPWTGCVWKMLLGPTNRTFDEMNQTASAGPAGA